MMDLLPHVAVDLDGVLADTMAACCKIINREHSTHFEVSSFVDWEAWKIANITKDEFFRSLDDAWLAWHEIPPTEERLAEKVGKLSEFSMVDVVTGRSSKTVASAKSWLKEQGIRFNSFVRTNSGMDKVKLDYDVYIDDSPELMSSLSLMSDCYGVLYTQPWNSKLPAMPRVYRVDSWSQIPERVRRTLSIK